MEISFAPIIYLLIMMVFCWISIFLIQNKRQKKPFSHVQNFNQKKNEQNKDLDVVFQEQKVIKAFPSQYKVLIKKLKKIYQKDQNYNKVVNNLSLRIKQNEVFGLLGVNGAGKTTVLKILLGQIPFNNGQIYIQETNLEQNILKIRQNIGYCPQFDALIQSLTVREQIQLYYDLKSLSSLNKDQVITQKIEQLDLQKYKDKLCGQLSGGNKRKVSLAIAIIGDPKIIILDEPSTGMDPKGKRFMWKIITKITSAKRQSSVIFSTHSKQQAQALSTRLVIMVHGQFKCIGTPQYVKYKYGQGYQVDIKLNTPNQASIMKYQTTLNPSQKQINKTIKEEDLFQTLKKWTISNTTRDQITQNGRGKYILSYFKQNGEIQT